MANIEYSQFVASAIGQGAVTDGDFRTIRLIGSTKDTSANKMQMGWHTDWTPDYANEGIGNLRTSNAFNKGNVVSDSELVIGSQELIGQGNNVSGVANTQMRFVHMKDALGFGSDIVEGRSVYTYLLGQNGVDPSDWYSYANATNANRVLFNLNVCYKELGCWLWSKHELPIMHSKLNGATCKLAYDFEYDDCWDHNTPGNDVFNYINTGTNDGEIFGGLVDSGNIYEWNASGSWCGGIDLSDGNSNGQFYIEVPDTITIASDSMTVYVYIAERTTNTGTFTNRYVFDSRPGGGSSAAYLQENSLGNPFNASGNFLGGNGNTGTMTAEKHLVTYYVAKNGAESGIFITSETTYDFHDCGTYAESTGRNQVDADMIIGGGGSGPTQLYPGPLAMFQIWEITNTLYTSTDFSPTEFMKNIHYHYRWKIRNDW